MKLGGSGWEQGWVDYPTLPDPPEPNPCFSMLGLSQLQSRDNSGLGKAGPGARMSPEGTLVGCDKFWWLGHGKSPERRRAPGEARGSFKKFIYK